MSGSIRLSKKHGVNPSVLVCFACGEDTGVGLLGALKNDAEAPHRMYDRELCKRCRDAVNVGGVVLIEKRGDKRTGRMWILKDEAFKRIFGGRANPKEYIVYVTDEVGAMVFGPPEEEKKG